MEAKKSIKEWSAPQQTGPRRFNWISGRTSTNYWTEYDRTNHDAWNEVELPLTDLVKNLDIFVNKLEEIHNHFKRNPAFFNKETEMHEIVRGALRRQTRLARGEVHIRAGDCTKDALQDLLKATSKERNPQKVADLQKMLKRLETEKQSHNIASMALYNARNTFMSIITDEKDPYNPQKIGWRKLAQNFVGDLQALEKKGCQPGTYKFENEVIKLISEVRKTHQKTLKENERSQKLREDQIMR